MYRIQAIILYRQIIRDSQIRIVLFSEEYGKITAWEKSQSSWDIGSRVEVLIERKNGQNQIKRLDVLSMPSLDSWSYESVIEYLYLLQILYDTLPEWAEQRSTYRDISECIRSIDTLVWKVGILLSMQVRVLKNMWYLNISFFSWFPNLWEWYTTIHSISMKSMLSDTTLCDTYRESIRTGILEARHTYSHRY